MIHRNRTVSRRQQSPLYALVIVLVMVLAACTAPAEPQSAEQEGADASGGAAMPDVDLPEDAAAEQVLRINTGSTGSSSFLFFPMTGGGDHQSWMPLLHAPPMYFDVDLELQPALFDTWEPNDDFTEWTFTIDPRAQWSDGTPITTADVIGTWELMADPLTGHGRITQYIGGVEGFDEVRENPESEMSGLTAVDDSTLQVTLSTGDPIFHWRIATTHMNTIKPEQARGALDTFWLPENDPLYSGPYMLESYDPDLQEASMVPNPNWWMDEGPYLERIEFRFQPEPETLAVMLQNDQVDASLSAPPLQLQEQFPDYFRPVKSFGFNTFWIAVTNEPTDDINVRKALAHGVDSDVLFQAAFPEGDGRPVNQIIDPDFPCLETEESWYDFDPEAAQEALEASEYGSADNLPKLRVTPRGTNVHNSRALQSAMEQWRQNLGITNVEFQEQPDAYGQDEELINISRDDVVVRFPDAASYMWVAAHSDGPIARAEGDMLRGYENPEVEALLEEALTLPVEDPQRCELALEAQRLYMNDYPTIGFGEATSTLNARDYVVDYEKGPDVGLIAPWRIYIREH